MSATLVSLLKSLNLSDTQHQDIDTERHESVLKACNEVLRDDKSNVDAQHVRIIALLSLDRYADVVTQIEQGGPQLKSRAHLEYAYALYKEGRLEDARTEARGIRSRAAQHLVGQSSYRLEDFSTAQEVFQNLQNEFSDSQDSVLDLRINIAAAEAQLEWQRKGELVSKRKASREDLENFETAFNAASASLARGELLQADFLLKTARTVCEAADLTAAEKKTELLPIAVQQLYVATLLNKTEQAEKIAEELNTDSAPDSSTSKLAQINRIVADKSNFNPYLASRVLNATPEMRKTDQFFEYQNQVSRQNNFALDFLSGKYAGIESQTAKQLKGQSSTTTSSALNAASTANAAAHAQLQLGKPGIKSILPLLEKRPYDLGLTSTLVQLYITTKNHGAAIQLVEGLCKQLEASDKSTDRDSRFSPGLVAILVSLYSIEGRKAQITTELSSAASHWKQISKIPSGLVRAAGHCLVRNDDADSLHKAEELFASLPGDGDRFTTAGTAAALSGSDVAKAAKLADSLTSIEKLTAGIEVDNLEAAGVPQATSTATILSRKRAADASKPTKKRARKSRLPKDYDPSKKVDPERWLPIRDRSYYKPKGKKKARNLGHGGAQGAIAADTDATPAPASTVHAAGNSNKSKKKKNKR